MSAARPSEGARAAARKAKLALSAPAPLAPAGVAADARVVAAPLVRRLASLLYDGVLVFGILFAIGLVYGVALHQTNAMQHRTGLIAACFLVLGLYFIGLWLHGGQTLAMKTWHLRVTTDTGAPLPPRRALARYLAAWVWFLPGLGLAAQFAPHDVNALLIIPAAWCVLYALSALLHPRRQFWHDALCGTAIVTARPLAPLPQ